MASRSPKPPAERAFAEAAERARRGRETKRRNARKNIMVAKGPSRSAMATGSATGSRGFLMRAPRRCRQRTTITARRRSRDIEIDDVRVVHPDAASGHKSADRLRLVGAVDRVFAAGRASAPLRPSDFAAIRPGSRRAATACALIPSAATNRAQTICRRHRPCRSIACRLSDADRIADGAAVTEREVEATLFCLDDDGAALIAGEWNDFTRPGGGSWRAAC